jgi:hypothetical protein
MPNTLDQRGDAAGEQIAGDQVADLLRWRFDRCADDQGNCNGSRVHDQHVLDPERNKPRRWKNLIDWMDRRRDHWFRQRRCGR